MNRDHSSAQRPSLVLAALAALLACLQIGCPRASQGPPPQLQPTDNKPLTQVDPPPQTNAPAPLANPDANPPSPPLAEGPDRAPASATETGGKKDDPPAETPEKPESKPAALDPDGFAKPKPLFDGWNKPQVVLVMTGRQNGYVEPCGCTGLTNQKGGLARRHTFLKQLRQRGWPVVAVDVGSQVRRYGAQPELKFQLSADGLKRMNFGGVAFGGDDLRLSIDALLAVAEDSAFMSANASLLGLSQGFRILEANGKKIGVTAILGVKQIARVNSDEIETKSAEEGLREVWPKLEEAECDVRVLLAHATLDESRALAKKFSGFDLVVTAGGADEPAFKPEQVEGTKTQLIQVGAKGMYVGVIGVFNDPDKPTRFERVPLDARFEDSKEMLELMKDYQEKLQRLGLEKLGVRPLPHESGHRFVGSAACAECHEDAYETWKDSGHGDATDSLKNPTERVWIARHHDPECLSCHVTGWNPQKFVPYLSGYESYEASKHLRGSGCENCHGPGSQHRAAERGDIEVDAEQTMALRKRMRLPLAKAEAKCIECHDHDNSPDFHAKGAFMEYWRRIKH